MLFRIFHGRPLLLTMVLLIASLLGVVGYFKLPRNMYPDVERPQVLVVTQLPGASALSVAQKIAKPMEQELYSLSQVRDVQSTNKNELSSVRVEFEYEKGLDAALLDVNNALSRIRAKLPTEALPSSVYAVGSFTAPVMVLSLSPKEGSHLSLHQVRLLAENDIRNALVVQPHVANVEVFGGNEPAARVDFDPLKLAQYHIGQAQLQDIVSKFDRDWPLGTLEGPLNTMTLTVYGERAGVEQLRLMPIANGLRLGDVARVGFSHAESHSAYHGNGRQAIAVSVLRAPGGSMQQAIDDIQAQLPVLKARYPNIDFAISDTQGELIETSNSNMIDALRDAIVFTGLVILFFLGNWRAVVTALVSIPLVFLSTLAVLWLMGKELNILVMTGIILSLGMLVDDAVVVLENIERHLGELKEDVHTAIQRGTEEVLSPIFVGTVATAAMLAPLMFIGDFPQQIFKHLVLSVLIAVFISYFVAITFIPRLSAYWYRNGLPPKNQFELKVEALYGRTLARGASFYTKLLGFALEGKMKRRLLLMLPAFGLLIFSIKTLMPFIGRDALPPMDTGIVRVHVRFGANERAISAEEKLHDFEERLMRDPRVERVSAIYGSEPGVISLGSGQLPAEATINIAYVNRLERAETSWQIEQDLRQQLSALPGVFAVDAFDAGATSLSSIPAPIDIRLTSEDWRLLPAAAERVQAALRKVPGLSSVSTKWDAHSMEASLVLDESKLHSLGLLPDAIFLQLPLKGGALAGMSKLPTVGAIPVRSYFADPYLSEPETLTLLPIRLPNGTSVNLGELGHIEYRHTVSMLTTDASRYSLDVLGYRNTAPISFLSENAQEATRKVLPPGIAFSDMGDAFEGTNSSKRMFMGLGVGVLLLVGVLVPAYGSVSLALLSILILPLSAIGAIWGLLIFNKALAMPAILGIVLLFSIIIKNSILMVDFIQVRREEEGDIQSAFSAVKLRYRPILMTALGTIAGMIPIALQRAIGLERLSPLADAAIGGLLLGTILSLFYLPMLFTWVSKNK